MHVAWILASLHSSTKTKEYAAAVPTRCWLPLRYSDRKVRSQLKAPLHVSAYTLYISVGFLPTWPEAISLSGLNIQIILYNPCVMQFTTSLAARTDLVEPLSNLGHWRECPDSWMLCCLQYYSTLEKQASHIVPCWSSLHATCNHYQGFTISSTAKRHSRVHTMPRKVGLLICVSSRCNAFWYDLAGRIGFQMLTQY